VTIVEDLADFVVKRSFEDLSSEAVQQLKIRVLDSLGWALTLLWNVFGRVDAARDLIRVHQSVEASRLTEAVG
jgi:2-methylcitrate dehydratase PrpD